MIFVVPDDFKGGFVSKTLKKALRAGMKISICGNDIYAADVKSAIANKVLIPVGDDYDEEMAKKNNDAMIVNRTDRVLVLGKIVLKPWESLLVSKNILKGISVMSAEKQGYIYVVSDEVNAALSRLDQKQGRKKAKEVVREEPVKAEFVSGADKKVAAKVWDFRSQESLDAQIVQTTPDVIQVDKEPEVGNEVDFVDKKEDVKATEKKVKRKSAVKKDADLDVKKKGMSIKKSKVKTIEPVGEKRREKGMADAAIELDSRGNPIGEKASDTLQHLIDSLIGPEDVSFVDEEQAKDRQRKIDME